MRPCELPSAGICRHLQAAPSPKPSWIFLVIRTQLNLINRVLHRSKGSFDSILPTFFGVHENSSTSPLRAPRMTRQPLPKTTGKPSRVIVSVSSHTHTQADPLPPLIFCLLYTHLLLLPCGYTHKHTQGHLSGFHTDWKAGCFFFHPHSFP